MTKFKSNIWKIYIYKFLSEFYLIVPILIPFYESNGLTKTQVFTVQASYALAVLLLEVPSGYLADVIGRRKTLILGAIGLPLGLFIYVSSGTFFMFVLAELVLAAAGSMRSGCESALIYDTLIQMGAETEYKKFEGRTQSFTRFGSAMASILGGLAALLSFNTPFYINIATSVFMLPLALSLIEPERKSLKSQNPLRDILRICGFCFTHPKLRLLMLFSAMIMSTSIVGVWSYFLYYESLKINLGYFGIIFAVFHLSSALGSTKAHSLEKTIGPKKSITLALVIGINFLLLGFFREIWLIPLIFLNALIWGLVYPLFLDYMNRLTKSETRATVLSVANMTGALSYVIIAPLFGKLVDLLSLAKAHIIIGIYVLLYGSLATLVFLRLSPFIDEAQPTDDPETDIS
ncbi:MFS transporter [Acidobacteriota bacterium]